MGKKQLRRAISIRPAVYDRLMYYIKHRADPASKPNCSALTEAALMRMLDDLGVPSDVPHYERPSEVKAKPEPEPPMPGQYFTF